MELRVALFRVERSYDACDMLHEQGADKGYHEQNHGVCQSWQTADMSDFCIESH